jgi:hypothetical protein
VKNNGRRIAIAVVFVGCCVGLGLFPTLRGGIAQPANVAPPPTEDAKLVFIRELAYAFPGEVDVYLRQESVDLDKPFLRGVRIETTTKVVGEYYLRVQLPDKKTIVLLDPKQVVAYRKFEEKK